MTLNEALVMTIITACIGLPLSLFIRIKREEISNKDYIAIANLMCKFLIIYPFILFPFIAYSTKDIIADRIATEVLKRNKNCIKKNKKEIKEDILSTFGFGFIMKLWRLVLKDMFRDYDLYVDETIRLAKRLAKEKRKEKQNILKHKRYDSYQREIIKNADMKELSKQMSEAFAC
ncbi:hypothetical protein ACR77J_15410 [Tissierella praeacuta]|uniref:hypothetical protein n=1 Tax=Tissierella praeacuta TaxID=43131 RepID=UPI003DA35129